MQKIKTIYHLLKGWWQLRHLKPPIKIAIGSDGFPPGWIHTNKRTLDLLRPEQWAGYFEEDSIDNILAEHVWEHLTRKEGIRAAKLCHRYLKPGGVLRVAVPDGFNPDREYITRVRPPGFGHKKLYDIFSLIETLRKAGFWNLEICWYHQKDGMRYTRGIDPERGEIQRKNSLVIDAIK